MVSLDLAAIRQSWKVMKGFVAKTFFLNNAGIIATGEINRRTIRAEIEMKSDLPYGLEIESAGFGALVDRYDTVAYNPEANTLQTSDGEFAIVVKQDKDGILAEMLKAEIGEEHSEIDISAVLPNIGTMVNVLATSAGRALIFVKGDVLAATDDKRVVYAKHDELKDWSGDEVKALPGEMLMLARRAARCTVAFTDEAIVGNVDGCKIYQELVPVSDCGRGTAITSEGWINPWFEQSKKLVVNADVLADALKFVSGFAEVSGKGMTKVVLGIMADGVCVEIGRGRKNIPLVSVEPELVGKEIAFNIDYVAEAVQHFDVKDITILVKPDQAAANGAGVVFTQDDGKKDVILMTVKGK